MGKYLINGGRKLSGKIRAESAKNSVLPILAASILTSEQVVILDCPMISDVVNMISILRSIGVKITRSANNLIVDSSCINDFSLSQNLSGELRSSIYMMGALVSRVKKAKLYYPGGCDIGLRPIDIHISALKSLGVSIEELGGEIVCTAGRLKGADIYLDFPSVGATENAILAAVKAEGKTEIHNAAKEPEIIDLMNFINSMGGKVFGAGTSTILVEGVKNLSGTTFRPSFDRIEAGTYLLAAAITGGEIEISNCNIKNISSLVHKLCDNTCKVRVKDDIIYLKSGQVGKSFNLETGPYPCFPTDLQAPMTALACVSEGISVITENVFEMRYKHVPELIKMGADISVKGRTAIVRGVKGLNGASVRCRDLRGGASLVLAGLAARNCTEILDVYHVERGYFNLEEKLRMIGADVVRE